MFSLIKLRSTRIKAIGTWDILGLWLLNGVTMEACCSFLLVFVSCIFLSLVYGVILTMLFRGGVCDGGMRRKALMTTKTSANVTDSV